MEKKLSAESARSLVDKLSTDDEFRALFEKDPATALEQVGAPAEVVSCCRAPSGSLASKEAIAATADALMRELTSTLTESVHKLSA